MTVDYTRMKFDLWRGLRRKEGKHRMKLGNPKRKKKVANLNLILIRLFFLLSLLRPVPCALVALLAAS